MSHIKQRKERSIILASEKREERRNQIGKKKWVDGVNQRANRNQHLVVEKFNEVIGGEYIEKQTDLCSRLITYKSSERLKNIDMHYYSTNSIFARGYDLIIKTHYDIDFSNMQKQYDTEGDFIVGIKFRGVMRIIDCEFYPVTKDNVLAYELSEMLNKIGLLKDRILYLEAIDVRIHYSVVCPRSLVQFQS